jgi:hypothetical protein
LLITCDHAINTAKCRNAPNRPNVILETSSRQDRPEELYFAMNLLAKAHILVSFFLLSNSKRALGTPAEVFGNISDVSCIQFSTTPLSKHHLETQRYWILAVDAALKATL